MKNKNLILLILVLIIFVVTFYYLKVSSISINIPVSNSGYEKMVPSNYSTESYSSDMIKKAEDKISEIEIKLNKVKEKDLEEYDFLHKKFLENMITEMEVLLEKSKENLLKAKNSFDEENYFNASNYSSLAYNTASIIPRHLNNIMEGRTKDEWNRLNAILDDESTPIDPVEIPVDENGEPIIDIIVPINPSDYSPTTKVPISNDN